MIDQPRFRCSPRKGTWQEVTEASAISAPPPRVSDLLLVSCPPPSAPLTLWASDTHDLCCLRPLPRLPSPPQVTSPEHTRPGEAVLGHLPRQQVATLTPVSRDMVADRAPSLSFDERGFGNRVCPR